MADLAVVLNVLMAACGPAAAGRARQPPDRERVAAGGAVSAVTVATARTHHAGSLRRLPQAGTAAISFSDVMAWEWSECGWDAIVPVEGGHLLSRPCRDAYGAGRPRYP
jgi:hypothetical protein